MYNINISYFSFEWDERKNRRNLQKHGLDFEEAQTGFYDENAILFDDPDHSAQEDRFLIIGMSAGGRVCIVSHCYRKAGDSIRIISARKAVQKEQAVYCAQFE